MGSQQSGNVELAAAKSKLLTKVGGGGCHRHSFSVSHASLFPSLRACSVLISLPLCRGLLHALTVLAV